MNKQILVIALIGSLFFLTSCEEDGEPNITPTPGTLKLAIQNLPDVGPDYVYEGWMIVNGKAITTGVFSVNAMGDLSKTSFSVDAEDLAASTKFVLTIEPAVDPDPAPSSTHIISGDFYSSSAGLNTADGAALGTDFSSSAGKYILATPTDNDMGNELSGIWFLDNSSGSPAQGLNLPSLPAGWKYEGWVVVNGTPLSTGKFTELNMEDDAAPFSSMMNSGPPFPGEDLLLNAPMGMTFPLDLSGGTAVISLEPDPDNSPAPFDIKPLVGAIPMPAMDHLAYDLMINLGNLPSGTATR